MKELNTREDLLRQLKMQINYLENTTKRLCLLKGFKEVGYSYPTSIVIDKSEHDKDNKYTKSCNDYVYEIRLEEIVPDYRKIINEHINKDYEDCLKYNKEAQKSMVKFLNEAFKDFETLE